MVNVISNKTKRYKFIKKLYIALFHLPEGLLSHSLSEINKNCLLNIK